MDNAKFARLGRILELLHKGESLSIKDLSEEFGVSERTLQRDIYQRLGDKVIKINGNFQLTQKAEHQSRDAMIMQVVREVCQEMGEEFVSRIDEIFALAQKEPKQPQQQQQPSAPRIPDSAPMLKITYCLADETYKIRLVPQGILFYENQYWLQGISEQGAEKIPLVAISKMKPIKIK